MKLSRTIIVLCMVWGTLSVSATSESNMGNLEKMVDLWLGEVEGQPGHPNYATKMLAPVNCTGLTRLNGILYIDIKWESSTDRLDGAAVHLGTNESNYWRAVITHLLNINDPGEWNSYIIPMENWTEAGTVNVNAIEFLGTYTAGGGSPTQVWWRNARIGWENEEIVDEIGDAGVLVGESTDESDAEMLSYATEVTDIARNSATLHPKLRQFVYRT